MNKPTILVVEDDVPVRCLITTTLKTHGYKYLTASNGETAIMMATSHNPDIMLLDLGLPDIDGIEVIRSVRTWSNLPIIVLSARSEESDKIEALDNGADDYLTKPFSMKELMARIRAMTRRKADTTDSVLTFGDITLDRSTYMLTGPASIKNADSTEKCDVCTDTNNANNGKVSCQSTGTQSDGIRLANKEYQMLEMLMTNPGQIISVDQFMDRIWGYDSEAEQNVVWVYISYLRKKLASVGSTAQIKATRGVGYSIINE